MEVIKSRSQMLTNWEVLELLREVQGEERKRKKERAKNVATILHETSAYLEKTKWGTGTPPISRLVEDLRPFRLTEAETLQILNSPPRTPVEVQLMVEECEERLSEEDVNALIQLLLTLLPPPPEPHLRIKPFLLPSE